MPADFVTHDADEEVSRLDSATENITGHLLSLASRVEKEIDPKLAEVFGVHQLILNDRSLQDELRKEIAENLVSAASAVKTVFLRWENRFQLMESQFARDKGDDMRDLSNRLCDALAGHPEHEERLLACEIESFSVAPLLIPAIKEQIRNV